MPGFENIFRNRFDDLPEYLIEIGVVQDKTKRKKTIKVGITNAEILFINENGSPLRNLPARPVLQMTIDYANKNLLRKTMGNCIDAYLDSDFDEKAVEKELNKLCIRMESYARKLIYSNKGHFASNAPSTIKKKGFDHPLFETGQLARSITCHLVKI